MSQQSQPQLDFGYKRVHLIKTKQLGAGSYGAVYKAMCDDLPCAGKILHPTLFQSNDSQAIQFKQECRLLNSLRHPNIVQFLGLYTTHDRTKLPVLLMELMDDNLTRFLEQSHKPLPYQTQVNICYDIALALSYLHSNDIIHRDLSSNNVLLIGAGSKAKVADFGMAKFFDVNCTTRPLQTRRPGTEVYMSPEALDNPPHYTTKLDCFSFGVLGIQIITCLFPSPSSRTEYQHYPSGRPQVNILETKRRKSHIDLIDPTHPLLPIATDCLSYNEEERPLASDLCHRLDALKQSGATWKEKLTPSWKRAREPCKMTERSSATMCEGIAYFSQQNSRQVHSYNLGTNEWSTLPNYPTCNFTLTVVNNILTAVGGRFLGNSTNKLLSIDIRGTWFQEFLPMITPREFAAVVCSRKALVVAGGECKVPNYSTTEPYFTQPLDTVEVMNTDTQQWSIANSLPQPLTNATATVCGDTICLVGGRSYNDDPTKSVFVCSLNAFLPLLQKETMSQAGNHTVWSTIADLPVEGSTCVTLNGQLLAVGGYEPDSKNPTNNILSFDTVKNSWEVIGQIHSPRFRCVLTIDNILMVVGAETDNIEIGRVHIL